MVFSASLVHFRGYLHAHISYLDEACECCLLLLTVDRDVFFTLSECKQKIQQVSVSPTGCVYARLRAAQKDLRCKRGQQYRRLVYNALHDLVKSDH